MDDEKSKYRKENEENEKIIDNQFQDINMFEHKNSFLGSIISSCDDEDDDFVSSESSSEPNESEASDKNSESEDVSKPTKTKKRVKRERLIVNIAYTQYPVVKEVGKMFNFKITRNDEADWDLIWLDG